MERQPYENRWPAKYDTELQMFVEAPRELNLGRLRFLRHLADQGRLEQKPYSPPTGAIALAEAIISNNPIVELPEVVKPMD